MKEEIKKLKIDLVNYEVNFEFIFGHNKELEKKNIELEKKYEELQSDFYLSKLKRFVSCDMDMCEKEFMNERLLKDHIKDDHMKCNKVHLKVSEFELSLNLEKKVKELEETIDSLKKRKSPDPEPKMDKARHDMKKGFQIDSNAYSLFLFKNILTTVKSF